MDRAADGGTHIGIRNVRERIETMCGGSLKVDSRIGEGTTVTIRFPLRKRGEEGNSMRVICVDDALPIMEDTVAMCRQLPGGRRRGLYPRRRRAALAGDQPADLALLDIDMPEMNGLKLAAEIKAAAEHGHHLPDGVFRSTRWTPSAARLGYLLKPVSREAGGGGRLRPRAQAGTLRAADRRPSATLSCWWTESRGVFIAPGARSCWPI